MSAGVQRPGGWDWRGWGGRGQGFTMIELLVVISIIALLAALVVGGVSRAARAGKESRLRAELNQVLTAIESYKEKLGSYPPDIPTKPAINPLYYELTGVVITNLGNNRYEFRTKDGGDLIPADKVPTYFENLAGFQNATPDPVQVRRFIELASRQHAEIDNDPDTKVVVKVLVAPVPWPRTAKLSAPVPIAGRETLNPWRYLAPDHATNNPGSFDLWADYVDGRQVKRISNWSRDPVVVGVLQPDGSVNWQ